MKTNRYLAGLLMTCMTASSAYADTPGLNTQVSDTQVSNSRTSNGIISGGVSEYQKHMQTGLDRDIFQGLVHEGSPDSLELASVLKFVDNEANVSGSVRSCSAPLYDDFVSCARIVLVNWNRVTGKPMPEISFGDGRTTEDTIEDIWVNRENQAASLSQSRPQDCPSIVDGVRKSKLWKFCSVKDAREVGIETGVSARQGNRAGLMPGAPGNPNDGNQDNGDNQPPEINRNLQ